MKKINVLVVFSLLLIFSTYSFAGSFRIATKEYNNVLTPIEAKSLLNDYRRMLNLLAEATGMKALFWLMMRVQTLV